MGASGEEEVEIGFKLGDEGAEERVQAGSKHKPMHKKSSHTRKACVRR